jgi:poly(A) polymerase
MTSQSRNAAAKVLRALRENGHRAYFAGGAVRDSLLGRPPSDWDVATSARPDDVRSVFDSVVPVGERFGVVLVVLDGVPVEVATFRHDAVYEDGRRPVSVRFTDDPEEDARRRDFTVNGLFLDPVTEEVLDFTEGRSDLRRRRLRAIGDPDLRFDEDRLRMLRAVRFAVALDFEIEEATFRAMRARAPEIRTVSGERIRDELLSILTGPRVRRAMDLLLVTGLLDAILPEVARMVGVRQPPRFHPEGDVWVHTLHALERLEAPSATLALATLLHDVGKPPTRTVEGRARFDRHAAVGAELAKRICRHLRLSGADSAKVVDLVHTHLKFMDVRRMREAKLRRLIGGPEGGERIALHRVDCLASHGDLDHWEFSVRRREEILAEPEPPPRLLTGEDLIELGFTPGPSFARILSEAEDLTVEGTLKTREEAREWARSRPEAGGRHDDA